LKKKQRHKFILNLGVDYSAPLLFFDMYLYVGYKPSYVSVNFVKLIEFENCPTANIQTRCAQTGMFLSCGTKFKIVTFIKSDGASDCS